MFTSDIFWRETNLEHTSEEYRTKNLADQMMCLQSPGSVGYNGQADLGTRTSRIGDWYQVFFL